MAFSSCATLFNSSKSTVSFETSETVNYVFEEDTLINEINQPITTVFTDSREPLKISFFNDQHSQTVFIKSRRARLYYLNFFTPYWVGFLVDELNSRKWEYPRRVYIDIQTGQYLPYFPMDTTRILNLDNRISITPLAPFGYQHPGIELTYQKLIDTRFAYQIGFKKFISANTSYARRSRGFNASLEFKRFFRNTKNSRFYVSMVFEHINKKHQAVLGFSNSHLIINNPTEPAIGYQKLTDLHKKFYSLTPRFGIEIYLTNSIVLDTYIGAGIRHRNVKHLNAPPDLRYNSTQWEWFDIEYDSHKETNSIGANIDMNFRVGWVF